MKGEKGAVRLPNIMVLRVVTCAVGLIELCHPSPPKLLEQRVDRIHHRRAAVRIAQRARGAERRLADTADVGVWIELHQRSWDLRELSNNMW